MNIYIYMSASNLETIYDVSALIAQRLKPFSDGEFVRDCLPAIACIVCPEKKSLFENIRLSRRTITRRIEELSANVKSTLQERATQFSVSVLLFGFR